MNATDFSAYYEYHFSENRKTWDRYIETLSQEQFEQEVPYSHGSIRNHVVHLANVENDWFTGLRGFEPGPRRKPEELADRAEIRAWWDSVEAMQRAYLAALTDEILDGRAFPDEEGDEVRTWQVLLHVTNHATDHRAQMLRVLHDMGIETQGQDYAFFFYPPS